MFLKGIDKKFLLSKDERLTPDIDEVTAVNRYPDNCSGAKTPSRTVLANVPAFI